MALRRRGKNVHRRPRMGLICSPRRRQTKCSMGAAVNRVTSTWTKSLCCHLDITLCLRCPPACLQPSGKWNRNQGEGGGSAAASDSPRPSLPPPGHAAAASAAQPLLPFSRANATSRSFSPQCLLPFGATETCQRRQMQPRCSKGGTRLIPRRLSSTMTPTYRPTDCRRACARAVMIPDAVANKMCDSFFSVLVLARGCAARRGGWLPGGAP